MGKTSSYKAPALTSATSGGAMDPYGQPTTVNPYTSQMVTDAQGQANSAIGNQQSFLNALQGQNGIQNQSSVFNQLQGVANGQGPNPAQAMLAQATGANTANQAALMAGQRGAGTNAGLIARQAAQQGAANQQSAAGQGATMQANQSLGALGQLGSLAGQQVAQQAGANQALTGATLQNQAAQMGALQGQNQMIGGYQQNANALAQQTQAQNASNKNQVGTSLIGGLTSGAGAALGAMAKGGMVKKYADGGSVSDNFGLPTSSDLNSQLNSIPGLSLPDMSSGSAPNYSLGANSNNLSSSVGSPSSLMSGAPSILGAGLTGAAQGIKSSPNQQSPQFVAPKSISLSQIPGAGFAQGGEVHPVIAVLDGYAKGGKIPALVSPGEKIIAKKDLPKIIAGKKDAMNAGKTVPGKIEGKKDQDTYATDTVPKKFKGGEMVLPKSVTQSKNPHWAAHKFVLDEMKKAK